MALDHLQNSGLTRALTDLLADLVDAGLCFGQRQANVGCFESTTVIRPITAKADRVVEVLEPVHQLMLLVG